MLAEAVEAGVGIPAVLLYELLNHWTEHLRYRRGNYDIMPLSTGWAVKCEQNTWLSITLILFHVPGVFTSELLRELQEGEK